MKKIIITLMMLLIMVSSVSAFTLVSGGQLEFDTNNDRYNGPAYVIAVAENVDGSGGDTLRFEFSNELKSQVESEGYEVDGSGSVYSNFDYKGWEYPLVMDDISYSMENINDKFFWTSSNALNWCNSLGGFAVLKPSGQFNYDCLQGDVSGWTHSLDIGTPRYDAKYYLTINGITDTLSITDTARNFGVAVGSRNYFVAQKTSDDNQPSKPDLHRDIYTYDTKSNNNIILLRKTANPSDIGFSAMKNFVRYTCANRYSGDECVNAWNIKTTSFLSSNRPSSTININNIQYEQTPTASNNYKGSILYDDGNIHVVPKITLTVDAERLVVERTFGIGEITNVNYPSDMTIGNQYSFSITTKNVGDADMTASLNLNCNSYQISGITTVFGLTAGQSKTQTGKITFTGSVAGCETGDKCLLEISNYATGVKDDSFDFSPEVCPQGDCSTVGSSECFGDLIRRCVSQNGVLLLQDVTTCSAGSSCDDFTTPGNAVCTDDNRDPVCGDGLCDSEEYDRSSRFYCSSDIAICTVAPICGDGTCDANGRESIGGEYQCVKGINDAASITGVADCSESVKCEDGSLKPLDGECPKPPVTPTTVFLIVGGAGLAGAIGLRLKKDGYF